MEIREGAFIKATVNGKKAGFVVFNNKIWLLSYVTAWDEPTCYDYDDVPRHGFFKKKPVWYLGSIEPYRAVNESTFELLAQQRSCNPWHYRQFHENHCVSRRSRNI